MKKILAIILARGESKGIKNKNIANVCGRPLIYYTVKPALELKKEGLLDEVIISTDSKKIAGICKKLGADVPFLRPKKISGDKAKSIDAVLHAIKFFKQKNIFYNYVIILQPTSPMRTKEDIKKAINIFKKSKTDSLISAYKSFNIHPYIMYYKKNKRLISFLTGRQDCRRQDFPEVYIRNGAIYIFKSSLAENKKSLIGKNPAFYLMPREKSVNIDKPEDLKIIKNILCK